MQVVIALAAVEDVTSTAAVELVIALAAKELVMPIAAIQPVFAAEELIVAVLTTRALAKWLP